MTYTLNKKFSTSPSLTTYSLPSARILPASLAPCSPLKALADAKLDKKESAAMTESADDKGEANYKVAAEKCDALAGDAKASCMSASKVRFGKS